MAARVSATVGDVEALRATDEWFYGALEVTVRYLTPHSKWSIHSEYQDNLFMLSLSRGGPDIWMSNIDAAKAGGAAVIYDDLHPRVEAGDPAEQYRFNLAAGAMPKQLEKYGTDPARVAGFDFRLISRRSKARFNSIGQPLKNLGRKVTTNPAYMHPDHLAEHGLKDGDVVRRQII